MISGLFILEKYFIISKQLYFYNFIEGILLFIIDAIYFYFYHRLLHSVTYLYTNIYKIHHQ